MHHAHVALGTAHGKLGNREEARKAFAEAFRLHPGYAAKGREEADRWLGLGPNTELAMEALREAGFGDE